MKRLIKRLASYILVLFGLSILVFIIGRVLPGDPARQALGPRAPEATVEALKKEMNLDKPIVVQYGLWLKDAVQGDLGNSLLSRRPVTQDIIQYLPATIEIVILAGILMAVGGILLGILATKYSHTWFDGFVRVLSYLGIVAPAFVWAIIFILVFGYSLPILPTTGRLSLGIAPPPTITRMFTADYLLSGNFAGFKDAFMHLILPAISLMLGGMAQAARMTRTTMMDNSDKDYVLANKAYGVSENRTLFKYLLKPSMIPTVSVLAVDIAALFGNAFLVEQLFNYPGLSRYGMQAMLNKDLFAISCAVITLGIIVMVVNIIVDLIVTYLDPRVRLMGGSE